MKKRVDWKWLHDVFKAAVQPGETVRARELKSRTGRGKNLVGRALEDDRDMRLVWTQQPHGLSVTRLK